jgi:2-methylcitrate dehydratase PrpD
MSEISEVEAHVLSPHLKMIDHGVRIGDRASFLTSLPYQLAVAATKPDEMFDLNQNPAGALPAIQDFMARVRITADDTLLVDYPKTWPARVTVTTPLGRHDKAVSNIPGDTARGFTASDIQAKFERVLGTYLGEDAIAELWRRALGALDSREALLSTASVLASQSGSVT